MGGWFIYLLQSAVSLALLYLVFSLFLKRDTFFATNRFFLLFALVFSALVPLVDFSSLLIAETSTRYYIVLDTITVSPGEMNEVIHSHLNVFQVILVAYLTGAIIFAVRFVAQLLQLALLIGKYGITRKEGIRLVLIHKEYSPFSFFNLVFINAKDYQPDQLREIIEHERVHVRQGHTMDILLLEIMTIIQWFNPFIWLYRRSIKGLHEFLADEGVLLKGINVKEYQNMLLNQALGIQLNDLTNNFNKSLLKRRLIMMNTPKPGFAARLKPLLALPVIVLMAMAFTFSGSYYAAAQDVPPPPPKKEKQEVPPPPPKATKGQQAVKSGTADGKEEMVYKEVAEPPQFKGGQEAFINYIVQNVKYPEEAKKKGTTGRVFVEFIVTKTGKITTARILKSADPLLDEEALRVISLMPDWIPGKNEEGKPVNVSMALPIMFNLDGDKKDKE
jgi:TonB family protein